MRDMLDEVLNMNFKAIKITDLSSIKVGPQNLSMMLLAYTIAWEDFHA